MTGDGAAHASPQVQAVETRLAHAYLESHPAEAARAIERHVAADGAAVLREVEPAVGAAVLAQADAAHGAALLLACGAEGAARIVSAMALDAAARLLRRIDPGRRRPILEQCGRRVATTLERILAQPADTAAGLMDASGVAVAAGLTAGAALARARHAGDGLGVYVYVVGDGQVLAGVVSLRDLLAAAPRAPLASIMTRGVDLLRARADRAAIVAHPGWRRYYELPVVDEQGVFLGVLRYATVRRLERELAPDRPPVSSVAPLIAIGELYWVGLARVLGSLLAAFGAGAAGAREQR